MRLAGGDDGYNQLEREGGHGRRLATQPAGTGGFVFLIFLHRQDMVRSYKYVSKDGCASIVGNKSNNDVQ